MDMVYTICRVGFTSGVPIIMMRLIIWVLQIAIHKGLSLVNVVWHEVVLGGIMFGIHGVRHGAVWHPISSLVILGFVVREMHRCMDEAHRERGALSTNG